MSARDWLEFDGKPGTSATDVVAFLVVVAMLCTIAGTVALVVLHTVTP